jgi:hypothetical protein
VQSRGTPRAGVAEVMVAAEGVTLEVLVEAVAVGVMERVEVAAVVVVAQVQVVVGWVRQSPVSGAC